MLRSVLWATALFALGHSRISPAGESTPAAFAANQTTASAAATSLAATRGRTHPSYQVFAAQLHLPSIKALGNTTLDIGGRLQLDFSKADQILTQDKVTLTEQLQVPVEFLTALMQNLGVQAHSNTEDLLQRFETAVIDYKYLSEKWGQYHPPEGGAAVKAEAMKCLQGANLEKAWQLFLALPRPGPPGGLHTISAPPPHPTRR